MLDVLWYKGIFRVWRKCWTFLLKSKEGVVCQIMEDTVISNCANNSWKLLADRSCSMKSCADKIRCFMNEGKLNGKLLKRKSLCHKSGNFPREVILEVENFQGLLSYLQYESGKLPEGR